MCVIWYFGPRSSVRDRLMRGLGIPRREQLATVHHATKEVIERLYTYLPTSRKSAHSFTCNPYETNRRNNLLNTTTKLARPFTKVMLVYRKSKRQLLNYEEIHHILETAGFTVEKVNFDDHTTVHDQ
eukprot:1180868-Prorocentrum_minimum.AAC.4